MLKKLTQGLIPCHRKEIIFKLIITKLLQMSIRLMLELNAFK